MSIFDKETGSIFGLTNRVSLDTKVELRDATLNALPTALVSWFADQEGSINASGEAINYNTALSITTVFAAVRVLCESVSSLPFELFELIGNGHELAVDHWLYYMLTVEPNPDMTAFSMIEAIVASLCLAGNAYVEIERNPAGQPIALWPLHPRHTRPKKLNGKLVYVTSDSADEDTPGGQRMILREDMIHIPLFSFDGVRGVDPITYMRQSLGLTKAAERQAAAWFANNSMPTGGLLSTEDDLTPKQETEFRENWENTQSGMQKGRIGVLTGKWTFQSIGLNAEQVQFLQLRQFQRADIAAIYRLSPSQVGDTTRQSNSNKVQENLSFVVDTLRPYLTRIEVEFTRKLLPTTGRKAGLYKLRFDISERLRGDFLTTQQGYALGRQWGWLSANDVKRAEGDNIGGPELDVYLVPLNMVNAKALLTNDEAAQAEQQVKNSIRHLIPLWKNAFDRYCASHSRSFDTFSGAFQPVLGAISDAVGMPADADATTAWIDSTTRSLYRRSNTWPETWEDNYTPVMGAELTRTAVQIVRSIPPTQIVRQVPAVENPEGEDNNDAN